MACRACGWQQLLQAGYQKNTHPPPTSTHHCTPMMHEQTRPPLPAPNPATQASTTTHHIPCTSATDWPPLPPPPIHYQPPQTVNALTHSPPATTHSMPTAAACAHYQYETYLPIWHFTCPSCGVPADAHDGVVGGCSAVRAHGGMVVLAAQWLWSVLVLLMWWLWLSGGG